MSEMSEEDLMRRVYYKETFDGSPHSLNSATTEAKDNSSSEHNVKDENILDGKPQSLNPKSSSSKNNLGSAETCHSTLPKLSSPNFTLDNKTIDGNKNIEPKKKSPNSEFTYELPASLFDYECQNQLNDRSNNAFNNLYNHNDDRSKKFLDISPILINPQIILIMASQMIPIKMM